ncbi:glycosyltransferase [Salidesulfovibrio brasiliensis]|uniref:glycosyltransferase n=1 Tax=Salidesulfovibrio brasiliensis TaxID=221711 RepID=UPI000A94E51C|nr:glycosyltransferase [Salidesulfovibrio brasiliensis]
MFGLKPPRLSIIIPNYNYGRHFLRLARCLSCQTLGMDVVEIILVDDGSTDDSLQQAAHFEAISPIRFEVLAEPHDGRPGNVRNKGLAEARGEFLLCLDPDDVLAPGYLTQCVAGLDIDESAGLAYTDFTLVENDTPRTVALPDFDPALLATQNILSPTAVMRRSAWECTEGYRAETDYEDWDLWVQFAALGYGAVHIADPLYVHMVHGENYSFRARENDARAKALIVLENGSFFPAAVRHWARGVIEGEPWAIEFPRGIIPEKDHVEKLLKKLADSTGAR